VSAIEELRDYVTQLQRRFRLAAVARGSAIVTAAALVTTVVLTVIINRFAFSSASLWSARAVLVLALVLGSVFGLAIPLWRLGQRWWTQRAERAFPQFSQRLLTFAEQDRAATGKPGRFRGPGHARDTLAGASRKGSDPFLELLAADTLRVARTTDFKTVAPDALLAGLFVVGAVCVGTLVWMIRSGPGYLGYGAAALWTGSPPEPLYDVRVSPGDATIRRHTDQLVTAELRGFQDNHLKIHVRYLSASKWDETVMQPRPAAAGYQFLLSGVPEDLEYFVEAGSMQSRHFHLHAVDAPKIQHLRVTYHYPDWTKFPDKLEEQGGDLRAVEGTEARLEIVTDRPMTKGTLELDDGKKIALTHTAGGNTYLGAIKLEKDGSYHVTTQDQSQTLRISDDYFIEASPVKPPEVALVRPERDYRASPIEEVSLSAKADDPFGLSDLSLHYSVNGGPDRTVRLLKEPGSHSATGSAMIPLESLKLVPGDVVGVYAAAKDARGEAHTDISFIQIDPFEREFSQSQQSGGGGGGAGMANDQAQIAEREKEIIAATWKQDGARNSSAKQAAEQSKFLSDVQTTLRGQAFALAGRLGMRDIQLTNEHFNSFQQEMAAAANAMAPAAQKLADQQWSAAVAEEQKALQHLMRAEATFRQIEVAINSRGAGGGAVNSAGRDLASLFDLELDTQKNQYESAQNPFSNDKKASQIDEALKKLDELARRQNELAQRNPNAQQTAEERWQQEMLRRKADELQREIEQLARNSSSQSGSQSGSQSSGKQSGQSGQSGESGESGESGQSGESGSDAKADQQSAAASTRQALSRLRQAEDDMRRAVDEHSPMDARRAAERLREAMNLLAGTQRQDISRELEAMNRQARALAETQRNQAGRIADLRNGRGMRNTAPGRNGEEGGIEGLISDRQKLADDLAHLQQRMRTAQRQANERSHGAASKLEEALNDLESADTETHLQRSADMLRRGYAPLNDDVENQTANDLKHLTDQLGDAQHALADASGAPDDALDSVERLRSRLAALDQSLRATGDANGRQPGSQGQPGDRPGSNPGDQPGGGPPQRGGQPGSQPGGQPGAQSGQGGLQPGGRVGDVGGGIQRGDATVAGGALTGPVGGAITGGYRGGPVDGAWNSGTAIDPLRRGGTVRIAPVTIVPTPETRQVYQQGMNELSRLQQAVKEDPQARRQVDELVKQMQRLDPRRFPGNPAMVDELYARVLSGVDKLELQLRHQPVDDAPAQVRSGNPPPMPREYQTAVADYFRRLSKNP